jgi:type VI protein secretion system component Hcp
MAADLVLTAPTELPADVQGGQNNNWFIADSFSFGVEREMKESGEKGSTTGINIGVGELQECTISKSMDRTSMQLAQYAINGNSPGQAEIDFVEVAGGSAADDRPTEEVAFYYNKIPFQDAHTTDGSDADNSSSDLAATDQALEDTTPICYLKYKLHR